MDQAYFSDLLKSLKYIYISYIKDNIGTHIKSILQKFIIVVKLVFISIYYTLRKCLFSLN